MRKRFCFEYLAYGLQNAEDKSQEKIYIRSFRTTIMMLFMFNFTTKMMKTSRRKTTKDKNKNDKVTKLK
jgi:hypothetical protein